MRYRLRQWLDRSGDPFFYTLGVCYVFVAVATVVVLLIWRLT